MSEELTAEESAALEAMKTDTGEGIEQEQAEQEQSAKEAEDAPEVREQGEGRQEEVEFKSAREKPPEGMVPHQAMHAERVRRQEAERALQELRERLDRLEKPAEEAPKWVDPLEDPEGFRKYDEWRVNNLEAQLKQQQEAQQKAQQAQQRQMDAARQENEFRANTPDYDQALQHLYTETMQGMMQQGYSQQEAQAQISQQVNAIYDAATAAGFNFGEMLYLRAQKAGYKNQPQQSEAEKITRLAEAQQKTQGLGSAGGGKQQGALTADQLASMSDAEFDKAMRERPAEVRRAMGG